MGHSIFQAPAQAAAEAAATYRPDSMRDYFTQVQALPQVLGQFAAAVNSLVEVGQDELPLDRTVTDHLDRVAAAIGSAVTVAADGERIAGELARDDVRRGERP